MFNVADKSVTLVARWFVYVSVQYENTYIIACILIDTPRMLMNNCCHPPRRTMFYQFITQWNRHASSNCIDDLLLQDDTETLHLRGNANLCTLISSHSNMAPQKLTIHKTVVSMVSSCSFFNAKLFDVMCRQSALDWDGESPSENISKQSVIGNCTIAFKTKTSIARKLQK